MQDKEIVARILKEVSEEFNEPLDRIEDIHKSIWSYQRKVFSFPTYPDLLLVHWGVYRVHHTRLRRYMLKFFTLYRKDKVSRDVLKSIVTRYWPIYKMVLANYYKKQKKKHGKSREGESAD